MWFTIPDRVPIRTFARLIMKTVTFWTAISTRWCGHTRVTLCADQALVVAEAGGTVIEVRCNEGDSVIEEQVLLIIDSD